MQAAISSMNIEDHRSDQHWFDDPTDFCVIVELNISSSTVDSGDIFSLTICSPKWFGKNVVCPPKHHPTHDRNNRAVFGRHYLFMDIYDEDEINRTLRDHVEAAHGDDWDEIATRLARYFRWEFEDYRQ